MRTQHGRTMQNGIPVRILDHLARHGGKGLEQHGGQHRFGHLLRRILDQIQCGQCLRPFVRTHVGIGLQQPHRGLAPGQTGIGHKAVKHFRRGNGGQLAIGHIERDFLLQRFFRHHGVRVYRKRVKRIIRLWALAGPQVAEGRRQPVNRPIGQFAKCPQILRRAVTANLLGGKGQQHVAHAGGVIAQTGKVTRHQMRGLGLVPAFVGKVKAAPQLCCPLLVIRPWAFQQERTIHIAAKQFGCCEQKADLRPHGLLRVIFQRYGQNSAGFHKCPYAKGGTGLLQPSGKALCGVGIGCGQQGFVQPGFQLFIGQLLQAQPVQINRIGVHSYLGICQRALGRGQQCAIGRGP